MPDRRGRPAEDGTPPQDRSRPDDGSGAIVYEGTAYLERLGEYRLAAIRILAAKGMTNAEKVGAIARLRDLVDAEPKDERRDLQRELYCIVRRFLGCVEVDRSGTLLRDVDQRPDRSAVEQALWVEALARRIEGEEAEYQDRRFTLILAEAHRVYREGVGA